MDTYLFSIHKRWNDLIFVELIKKAEVRKTSPKPPFKAIVYEPFNGGGRGKVIGEFVCEKIEQLQYQTTIPCIKINENDEPEISGNTTVEPFYNGKVKTIKESCLTQEQLLAYGQGKTLYALQITAPKLYDKPKELGEFRKPCGDCIGKCTGEHYDRCPWQTITRPPQSYMRIQDQKER